MMIVYCIVRLLNIDCYFVSKTYSKSCPVMIRTNLIITLGLLSIAIVANGLDHNGPVRYEHTLDIIRARGFLGEMYTVKSAHGDYELTLYRIINPFANPRTLNKYPVLYGHGVLYDSSNMISRSERSKPRRPVLGKPTINFGNPLDGSDDNSLPFMFSNNNFDVWLFDGRGTNDKNRNKSVDINFAEAQKFWDFSLDEQGLLDAPLLVDFVLAKTMSKKLVYVGYSQTTLFVFELLSTAPEYADKFAAIVCMAPVAYVYNIRGLTLPLLGSIALLTPDSLHYNYLPQPVLDTINVALRNLCKLQGVNGLLCMSFANGIGGDGSGQISPEFFREFYKSTSLKTIKHFFQLILGRRFGMYDHGPIINMKKYGRPNPPAYDLRKVRSDRIILVRGLADFLSDPIDQEHLIAELGVKPYKDIVLPKYNHFDFIDGDNLVRAVNGPVMLAVYELLYKDGPELFKNFLVDVKTNIELSPAQVQAKQERSTLLPIGDPNNLNTLLSTAFTGATDIFNTFKLGFNQLGG